MQQGTAAHLGSADEVLDLTPFQIMRLLGWGTTQHSSAGGNRRLLEIREMLR